MALQGCVQFPEREIYLVNKNSSARKQPLNVFSFFI